jgi:hypothetical protein
MANVIKRIATRALDVALFGVGLVEGAAKGLVQRVRGIHGAPTPARVPRPREKTRPTLHERPTPDPYDVDVITPVGTTGAAPGYNPDTAEADLQQPGTEELMEPSTTKKVKAETDFLRKAAERNPDSGA